MCRDSRTMMAVPSVKQVVQAICKTGRLPRFPFFPPTWEVLPSRKMKPGNKTLQCKIVLLLGRKSNSLWNEVSSPFFLHLPYISSWICHVIEAPIQIRKRDRGDKEERLFCDFCDILFALSPQHYTYYSPLVLNREDLTLQYARSGG